MTTTTPPTTPTSGPGALRRVMGSEVGFATIVELVPWAGELGDARGQKPLRMAGHARLSPDAPGEALRELGHDVIVHVACRDRNRNGMQSLGWDLLSRGLTSVLAISGDYPVEGYEGLPKPVFDIDSVALLELLHELGTIAAAKAATDGTPDPEQHCFYLGCAIDPFKRLERDLVPQFLKLALKKRSGADYAITQVGYDAHRQDVLLRWMRRERIDMPVVGNAYILAAPVARAFNANRVPGCVVTDDLLALVEREATSPD
jgi:methylenetetrahydrofolate reductase (NADPH)